MTAQRKHSSMRSAFTLLELLIVIGIIALLAALLLLGMRSVMGSSKANATKITLQDLQGMLGEYEAKTNFDSHPDPTTGFSTHPQKWLWFDQGPKSVIPPFVAADDFWRNPYNSSATTYRKAPYFDALDAPGFVGADNAAARNGSRQILNTQIAMSMLLSLPANRTAMQKLSADRYFTPTWVGNQQVPTPGPDGVLNTSDDAGPPQTSEAVANFYLPGMIVQLNGIQYLCNSTSPPPVATTPSPGNSGPPWKDLSLPANAGTPTVPLLLDAWDNPIIFVPATGLRVRLLNGQSTNNLTDKTQTFIIISPEGKVGPDPGGSGNPVVLQPGRPFFASAGPDGDFSKGDDNIYSFQQ